MVKYLEKYLRTIGAFAGHLEEIQWGIKFLMLTYKASSPDQNLSNWGARNDPSPNNRNAVDHCRSNG